MLTLKFPDQIRFCKRVPLRGLFHVVRRRTGLEVKLAVEGIEVEVVMMRSARRWAWPLVSDVAEPVDTLIAAPTGGLVVQVVKSPAESGAKLRKE